MRDGLVRVAAVTPKVKVADVAANKISIQKLIEECAEKGCAAAIFPELSLTAYTCGDLFFHQTLRQAAEEALKDLMADTALLDIVCAVGLPVGFAGELYNTAAIFHKGKLLALVAKTEIPNYNEFYELRYFAPGCAPEPIHFAGQDTIIGTGIVFPCENVPDLCLGIEICEDVWSSSPPSTELAKGGASIIFNLSCSDETVGKAEYRRELVKSQSGRLIAGYLYADSGWGESSTDMVFAGHNIIAENGSILAESNLFSTGITVAEIDVNLIQQERLRNTTWKNKLPDIVQVPFTMDKQTIESFQMRRKFSPQPFVPKDEKTRKERCQTILNIQAHGLAVRLEHIGAQNAVLALSGGLDSTLALIVAVRAFDLLGLDRKGIHTVSMPCFGTTNRTKNNAECLAKEYGVDFQVISIEKAVLQHFKDIGQDQNRTDVTYENSQARERTQVVMDLANKCGGIVIGTGDLSELALGWATYNGDQMSMYGVNASIPKTLVRHLVNYEAGESGESLKNVLVDILETPVSPELLPPKDGEISQKTEDLVGPYELHDFFIYYTLRYGFAPAKIFRMAVSAFQGNYEPSTIQKWMKTFYRRFFAQQFKRSCMPDGVKVGSVTLSPRGDFRMPSDACAALWLKEAEELEA
ncbi:NAD(+) synthase [Scatolibacter rhodanostii]|uniref:NAD(+) synthase n=1 Tax=Scatolibacter rhodanostii TaxID=2014781 RepID=UPI000C07E86A|nr:NAD(+) synthase [Scatolibacter rhodanostii]